MEEKSPLFVTGHSLGAASALATGTGHDAKKGLDSAQVFVFGAPRVGQAEFVAKYNAAFGLTTYRLVHGALTLLLAPSIGDHLPDRYYTALTP